MFTVRIGLGGARKTFDQELNKLGVPLQRYSGRYAVNHWLHDEMAISG